MYAAPGAFATGVGEMDKASFTRFLVDTLMPAAALCQDGAIAFVCMDWRHMTEATARPARIQGVVGLEVAAAPM